jgi:hypothetical protein
MRGGLRLVVVALGLCAGAATAQDLTTSPRPLSRPAPAEAVAAPVPQTIQPAATPRPKPRPFAASAPPVVAMAAPVVQTAPTIRPRPRPGLAALPPQPVALAAIAPTLRPLPRPAGLASVPQVQEASAPVPEVKPERRGGLFGGLFGRRQREEQPTPADGFVCGDRDIKGEELAPITSRVRGCGVEEPVRVTSVDGIRLTTPATIDCTTARALKTWINEGMRPAFGRPEVVELRVAASYICRPRNNIRGAKISEHGRGKAIDISGFILSNGRELSISEDYNRTIRRAHKAACGIFGTTLGPGSDGYHEDHLHFDTANLDRPYCR